MPSTRDKLLNATPKRFEILEFPELECSVKVRGMSYGKRTEFLRSHYDAASSRLDMVKAVPEAIIECLVDVETNQPIFSAADRDTIAGLSPEVIEAAKDAIWRVIGLAEPVMEKNSGKTAGSAPSSGSRKGSTNSPKK